MSMEWYEAILLGLVQGLTEFLPVSSSGHLVIGREVLGVEASEDLAFEVIVHAATVLSTIVVFRKQIWDLLKGFFCGLRGLKVERVGGSFSLVGHRGEGHCRLPSVGPRGHPPAPVHLPLAGSGAGGAAGSHLLLPAPPAPPLLDCMPPT